MKQKLSLVAALELGRRRKELIPEDKKGFLSGKDVFELMSPILSDEREEHFYVILLNRQNKLIDKIEISRGGITSTTVDARSVFKYALQRNATSVILCHNHPSGNDRPSGDDVSLTKKMKSAGEALDINVIDHVIIADKKYFSFADNSLLNQ